MTQELATQDPMSLNLNDLLTLIFERSGAVRTLWNSYIVVVSAVVGVHVSALKGPALKWLPTWLGDHYGQIILTVIFGAFAYWNWAHIKHVGEERKLILTLFPKDASLFSKDAPSQKQWTETLGPVHEELLIAFHLVLDLIVVLIVWGPAALSITAPVSGGSPG
jgi:hypothetical protein